MLSSDEKLNQLISMVGDLKTELSTFQDEMREFKGEMLGFKDEMYGFRDGMLEFQDEMHEFKGEMLGFKDEMHEFKGEMLGFKDEMHEFKGEMHEFKGEMYGFKDEMYEFRRENKQEHELLRSQIASVAEALNATIVSDDERLEKLEQRVDMQQRVQDMHSTEILKLRAAI